MNGENFLTDVAKQTTNRLNKHAELVKTPLVSFALAVDPRFWSETLNYGTFMKFFNDLSHNLVIQETEQFFEEPARGSVIGNTLDENSIDGT